MAEATPKPGVDEKGVIREGKAEVLPNNVQKRKDGRDDVFYNPAQVFNRDLSTLVLSVFAGISNADKEERRILREKKDEVRRQREEQKEGAIAQSKEPFPSPEPGLHVLEALAATGIRSIRYAKELGAGVDLGEGVGLGVRKIVANDLDKTAVAHMRQNIAHNGVPEAVIEVCCEDAASHMYAKKAKGRLEAYDVIDVDPYGSCAPFLDAAVQSVVDGGLLCITSTDMPVLGGNHPETCFARYGGSTLKTASYIHEMSLRVVLHAIATSAAKYGREVRPLLSCSIDFYVRIFVQVFDSAARAKFQASKTGLVHQCTQCESFWVQPLGEASLAGADNSGEKDRAVPVGPTPPIPAPDAQAEHAKFKPARVVVPGGPCPECGGRFKVGGPFYMGPLFDPSFAERCLDVCNEEGQSRLSGVTSWKKITGLLTAITEEHPDLIFHYRLASLCKGLKLHPITLRQFKGTLKQLGYRVSHFHREPDSIKTDAPNDVVYDLMRFWAEDNPPKNCPLDALLKKENMLKRKHEGPWQWTSEEEARGRKVPRFLPNPEPHWGPKKAAGACIKIGSGHSQADAAIPDAAVAASAAPAAAAAQTTAEGEGAASATALLSAQAESKPVTEVDAAKA